MRLINSEGNLKLNWSENCVLSSTVGETKFAITDTKIYVPVVTLPIPNNKDCFNNCNLVLKEQLTGININEKCQSKDKTNTCIS